jgi:lon-related putative ATP-dependent protease
MDDPSPLPHNRLRWCCDPSQFDFLTTAELSDLEGIVGQERARDAIEFGVGMRRDGYNLFVLGPPGIGKQTVVERFLERCSAQEDTPVDWCYVNNFDEPDNPQALPFPAGRGREFRADMVQFVEDLHSAIPAALESDEHRHRVNEARQEFEDQHARALEELAEKAHEHKLEVVRTPAGVALAPTSDGQVISPEDFEALSEEQKKNIEQAVEQLQPQLQAIVRELPRLKKGAREKVKQVNRNTTRFAIEHLVSPLKAKYADLEEVVAYLGAVEADVVEHSDEFRPQSEESPTVFGIELSKGASLRQYAVNLIVDNADTQGAPVIYEDHPYYHNLIGRIDHRSQMGSLLTDFTLIKAGALHRANGGYLVVHARQLLLQPFAWEGLKLALRLRKIRIESLGAALSLISTVSLEPVPIPLDVKVVLLGDRLLYYLLRQYDPDFSELFKVAADFDDEIDRTPESCQLYAQLLATQARDDNSRPLDHEAVALMIEQIARHADDSEKLSTHVRSIADLVREADYWAGQAGADVVSRQHVQQAIDHQIHRLDRIRERVQEEIQRGTLLVDTEGACVGQVNGLSVMDLGDFAFGRPSRITATARLGKGELIDIEREVELGGAIHSKGVLILSSFLAARYARDRRLSLSASLVFEQSYGMVDGDSASVAELCALLSALAGLPIKQNLAITGSVNQLGQAQPIGGVNEKTEGFFDVCRARGLTGDQGVLIPSANTKHLMLRTDVVEAAADGQFHVYAFETIDEAIGVLTGVNAGTADAEGNYPPNTVNYLVDRRLSELAELQRRYMEPHQADKNND